MLALLSDSHSSGGVSRSRLKPTNIPNPTQRKHSFSDNLPKDPVLILPRQPLLNHVAQGWKAQMSQPQSCAHPEIWVGSSQVKPDLSKPQGQTEDMDGSLGETWSCSAAGARWGSGMANQHDTDWTRSSFLQILLFSCRKLGAMSRSDPLLLHTPAAWFLFIALGKLKHLPDLSVLPLFPHFCSQ